MTEAIAAADSAARADRAERLLETLRQREPAEADLQASAMVMAGLKLLQEMRGTPAVLDALSRLGPALVAECPAEGEAPAATSADPQPADFVGQALTFLRGLPVDQALAQADAAMMAAGMFVAEPLGAVAPAEVVPSTPTAIPPAHLALAVVEHLRTLHCGEAHERARATVAGAAAYLHETFGRTYAAALLDGTLQAAADHGTEMRGGRDSLDTLH